MLVLVSMLVLFSGCFIYELSSFISDYFLFFENGDIDCLFSFSLLFLFRIGLVFVIYDYCDYLYLLLSVNTDLSYTGLLLLCVGIRVLSYNYLIHLIV